MQLPDGASLERTDAVAKKVRDILQGDARRRHRRLDQRPQLPDQRGAVELGGRVRHSEAVGRARPPEQSASNLVAQVRGKLLGIPDAFALSFDPPSIPGLGATGGFEFQVEDLTRPRQRCAQRCRAGADRRGAQAAGAQPAAAVLLVLDLDAAIQLRSRPQQGEAARA